MESPLTNGSGSSPGPDISLAEKLKARHAANAANAESKESHKVSVEDVDDEEDIAHPPPSSLSHPSPQSGEPFSGPTMSDVAMGKQKVADTNGKENTTAAKPAFNLNSEEAFPSLGGPRAGPAAVSTGWGRKPASVSSNGAKAASNGIPTIAQSKPSRGPPSAPSPQAGLVSLPGRHSERIAFAPSQIIPRNQLKKPISEVLRAINKTSKARVEVREGQSGQLVFEGTGPVDAVRQALKEVANQIGSKQSIKVAIPASVRPFIIGRQGQTIQSISKKTGARINIPKQDDHATPSADDEDATIDITIEGDAVAAEMARREVQSIINERTSTVNYRLKDIPAEFYPFLAGPREANIPSLMGGQDLSIKIPHYHTWSDVAPPQHVDRTRPVPFVAQPSLPIRISGDREAAQAAREQIERQVRALRQQLTSHQLPIERGRHQFIVGQGGDAVHDFFTQTGCTVVVPPSHNDDEALYVIGPPDRIENAVDTIMDIAAKMAVSNVDISRQHAKAPPAHAHNLTRYLQERQAIAALEQQYGANIVVPTSRNAPASWQIFSQDAKQGMRARTDAMNLIAGHPPSRLHPMEVNPFFHGHIRNRAAQQVRKDHGVHILFPEKGVDSPELILVYEAPGPAAGYELPRQAPSKAEIQEQQKAIQEARKFLLNLIGENPKVVSRPVEAPHKYHEKIQRFVEREQRGLPPDQIPAQLLFGRGSAASNQFHVRGLHSDAEELNAKILAFIEQAKKDEIERGFTMSFDYPHKFASYLIGRRGDNIKKVSEDYDVEINYQDSKVELKGPKAKCEACKAHIMSLARKLEDEATLQVIIAPQYHYELKGAKGSQVIRLEDRYKVRINFPRTAAAPADDADGATESSAKNYPTQPPNVVIIKGPRKGAEEAREELMNLANYLIEHSHTTTISVSQKQIPSIIGSGGRELDQLRLETGCSFDMPKKDQIDASGRGEIRLKGTKAQVEAGKKVLLERIKTFDDTVTKSLEVDPKFHKVIIGPSGTTLQKIVIDAGGPEDRRSMSRTVVFPKQGTNNKEIRLEGRKEVVDKIEAAIKALVSAREGQITTSITVAPEKHRLLIGSGGSIRRKIESDYDVEVAIPKQDVTGPERSSVKITGRPANVEKAKEHIESLIKEQATETINVPRCYHHIVSDDGSLFRRLRNDHGVLVDHAGQKPPPRPTTTGGSRGRGTNGSSAAMPLITDDPDTTSSTHSWELVDDRNASSTEDATATIPWILRGNEEKLTKARELVEQALANAVKPSCTGYLILPDPKMYRFVIGPSGSTINSIRSKTGTTIQVPRQGSESEAIELKGPKEGVVQAKDLILEAVMNGAGGSGGRRRQ